MNICQNDNPSPSINIPVEPFRFDGDMYLWQNYQTILHQLFLAQEWYEIYRQEYNILVFSNILGVYQVFSVYAVRIFFIIFPFEHLVVYFSLKHHILLRLYIAIWVQKYKEKRKSPNLFLENVGKSPNLFLENVGKSPNLWCFDISLLNHY